MKEYALIGEAIVIYKIIKSPPLLIANPAVTFLIPLEYVDSVGVTTKRNCATNITSVSIMSNLSILLIGFLITVCILLDDTYLVFRRLLILHSGTFSILSNILDYMLGHRKHVFKSEYYIRFIEPNRRIQCSLANKETHMYCTCKRVNNTALY